MKYLLLVSMIVAAAYAECAELSPPAATAGPASAESTEAPHRETRVEAAVRRAVMRLKKERPVEELLSITPAGVAARLNSEERKVLGEQFLSFCVDVAVTVFVAVVPEQVEDAFWLADRSFAKTALEASASGEAREIWKKDFEPGNVGLGVHSLSRRGDQYFVIVVPRDPSTRVTVTHIVPALHDQAIARQGGTYLADDPDERIGRLPAELEGQVLVRGADSRQQEAHLAGYFRESAHPSTNQPDQVMLSVTEDLAHSMAVQWRTGPAVPSGKVRYRKIVRPKRGEPAVNLEGPAKTTVVEDTGLVHDAIVHHHEAVLTGLEPNSEYIYCVGDGVTWSAFNTFRTAPEGAAPFSFLYMGDIQRGYDKWSGLAQVAKRLAPDAAFCLTAGDQVNRGGQRNDWDALFHFADDVFGDLPIAPAVGNHEMYKSEPRLYREMLLLPENGDTDVEPERTYWFEYGNVLVVCLDGNSPREQQADWLEERLRESRATWKLALFHQPLFSVVEGRENPPDREVWTDLFDAYAVDVAFQGHDHGYLRSFPMKDGKPGGKGTIYIVSNAGWKMYEATAREYGERVINRTPMFQVLKVQLNPDRLVYEAYDADGAKLDEFTLQKP